MIVVEGPDGSGKTSLIKKLSKDLALPVATKAVGSDSEAVQDLRSYIDNSLDQGWHPMLYDRHSLISEGIYGPAWRGLVRPPMDDPRWLRTAHARWEDLAPTIILCLPPIEVVVENIRKDPTNSLLYETTDRHKDRIPKSIAQIYWQYYWYSSKHLNVFDYDYTIEGDYHLVKRYVESMVYTRTEKIEWTS